MRASAQLLEATRRQGRLVDVLDDENPALTKVDAVGDGRIALEISEEDPRTLIEQMQREAESAEARLARKRK
jgi:hypothetical protein